MKSLYVRLRISELQHILRLIDMRMVELRSKEAARGRQSHQLDLDEVVLLIQIRMNVQAVVDKQAAKTC